jgi:hypothetical protein
MAMFCIRRLLRAVVTTSVIWSPALFAQQASLRQMTFELKEHSPVPVETASLASLPAAPSAIATESDRLESSGAAPVMAVAVIAAPVRPAEPPQHRFWDRKNSALFAGVVGMATADFFVTRANLRSGGKELNPVTRVFAGSTPALAANFALETGGVIGLSYMFHKTGHHKLERATSLINVGASSSAVVYGLTHR